MKKLMLGLLIGLVVSGTILSMEPEEKIKVITSDEKEYEIPRQSARFSQTLTNLAEDIGMQAPIPLPDISSKDWETVYKYFVNPVTGLIKSLDEVTMGIAFFPPPLEVLLSILNPIELLDVQMKDRDGNPFDIGEFFYRRIQEKIKAEPDMALKLMQSNPYQFPSRFETRIAQALLIAQKIMLPPFKDVETWDLTMIGSVSWSVDGRLAITGFEDQMVIREVDGKTVPINVKGSVNSTAWSLGGELAIADDKGLVIRTVDGTMISVDTEGLGEIHSVAWSSDGQLAIGGDNGVVILQADGTMIPVDVQGLEPVSLVAWSSDGQLAIRSKNGVVRISQADGAMVQVDAQGLGSVSLIAWSPDGQLALSDRKGVVIRQKDGTMVSVDTQQFKYIYSIAWSPDGQLAVSGYQGAVIRQEDGTMIPVDTKGLKSIHLVAWSSDGQLAVVGEGILIRKPDGTMIVVSKGPRYDTVAWALDGRLAFGHDRSVGIYNEVPQEYRNLTVAQALLIIKLFANPRAELTDDEKELLVALDQAIKNKFSIVSYLLKLRGETLTTS